MLGPASRVVNRRARLKELGAAIGGTKQQLWERLVRAEAKSKKEVKPLLKETLGGIAKRMRCSDGKSSKELKSSQKNVRRPKTLVTTKRCL